MKGIGEQIHGSNEDIAHTVSPLVCKKEPGIRHLGGVLLRSEQTPNIDL